jgi:hypothetical protein
MLLLYIFAIKCLRGESYEMEVPEDVNIRPPKELVAPRGRLIASAVYTLPIQKQLLIKLRGTSSRLRKCICVFGLKLPKKTLTEKEVSHESDGIFCYFG